MRNMLKRMSVMLIIFGHTIYAASELALPMIIEQLEKALTIEEGVQVYGRLPELMQEQVKTYCVEDWGVLNNVYGVHQRNRVLTAVSDSKRKIFNILAAARDSDFCGLMSVYFDMIYEGEIKQLPSGQEKDLEQASYWLVEALKVEATEQEDEPYAPVAAEILTSLGGLRDGWGERYIIWEEDKRLKFQSDAQAQEYWPIHIRLVHNFHEIEALCRRDVKEAMVRKKQEFKDAVRKVRTEAQVRAMREHLSKEWLDSLAEREIKIHNVLAYESFLIEEFRKAKKFLEKFSWLLHSDDKEGYSDESIALCIQGFERDVANYRKKITDRIQNSLRKNSVIGEPFIKTAIEDNLIKVNILDELRSKSLLISENYRYESQPLSQEEYVRRGLVQAFPGEFDKATHHHNDDGSGAGAAE